MLKAVIIDCTLEHSRDYEYNQGCKAVVLCTIKALRESIPDLEITSFIQFSKAFSEQLKIRVVENKISSLKSFALSDSLKSSLNLLRCAIWAMLHKYFHLNIKALISSKKLKEYYNADIIIHLGTNHYSDEVSLYRVIEHSKDILLGVLLGKPVVMYAESIGPFKTKLASWLARFTLNKVSLITLREEISKACLEEIGVMKPPTYFTADPSFLLKPAHRNRIEEILLAEEIDSNNRPLIGITMTSGTHFREEEKSKYASFVKLLYNLLFQHLLPEKIGKSILAVIRRSRFFVDFRSSYITRVEPLTQIVDYLAERLNATVVFIPHVQQEGSLVDDRGIAQEISRAARYQDRVKVITNYYSPEELKGIIGQCDLFITARMHAGIGAMSQCVPIVFIQTSDRHRGIARMLGQERYICGNFASEELIPIIDDAWANRDEIKSELKSRQEAIKKAASLNATLVKELLDSSKKG